MGKAYDDICRKELWRVFYDNGVEVYLENCSLYVGCRACVRYLSGVGEYFGVNRGFRQGCNCGSLLLSLIG